MRRPQGLVPRDPSIQSQFVPVREQLRLWAMENDSKMVLPLQDQSLLGRNANMVTRPQHSGARELELFQPTQGGMDQSVDELNNADLEVGLDSRSPGDLVELR